MTATLSELLERTSALSARAPSFTTEADLRFQDLAARTSRSVTLRLAGRKPGDLRMQGTKSLLPTLFLLVANDQGVWLDVPTRHKTYVRHKGAETSAATGPGKTLLAFDPADFLRTIVPDPPAPDETWMLIEEPGTYVLQALSCAGPVARPVRTLVFDRTALALTEIRLFDPDGRVKSVARFERDAEPSPLPSFMRLERPFDRIALELRFRRPRAVALDDAGFRFETPAGRTLVDVAASPEEVPEAIPGVEGAAEGAHP